MQDLFKRTEHIHSRSDIQHNTPSHSTQGLLLATSLPHITEDAKSTFTCGTLRAYKQLRTQDSGIKSSATFRTVLQSVCVGDFVSIMMMFQVTVSCVQNLLNMWFSEHLALEIFGFFKLMNFLTFSGYSVCFGTWLQRRIGKA